MSNFFPWKKNNTDRNGVNTQNTHMHAPNTQKDNTGKSSNENKWYNTPFFMEKICTSPLVDISKTQPPLYMVRGRFPTMGIALMVLMNTNPLSEVTRISIVFLKFLLSMPAVTFEEESFFITIFISLFWFNCCKTNSTKTYHPRTMKIYACNYVIFD